VNRLPLFVVAVLVATTMTAAAVKWHAGRPSPAQGKAAATLSTAATAPSGAADGGTACAACAQGGLGAGAPPSPDDDAAATEVGSPRMLHGDARHTGRAAGDAPAESPAVAWSRDLGGPIEAQVVASPDEQTLYVASLGGALTALAAADGPVRWTLAFGDRAYGTPCVAEDGTIYVGSDAKKFLAVTPEGKVKWTLETDGDADTGAALGRDGTVIFAAGRMVYGLTPLGYVKWRFAAKRKVFSSPAIAANGRVFFGSQDHRAYGLSPDGKLAWSVDLGADVDASPAVGDDGAVYFGTDAGELVRLDPDDGKVVWRAPLGGYVRGALAVARNGDVLAGVYGPVPRQVRVAALDGAVRGAMALQGTGARDFGVHGGALEDERGRLLFGAQDDAVYAIDANGALSWRFTTGADVDAPLTLLRDGTVLVGSDDGTVYALRARTR
jgi:outer membrane protein assembly factor BamB